MCNQHMDLIVEHLSEEAEIARDALMQDHFPFGSGISLLQSRSVDTDFVPPEVGHVSNFDLFLKAWYLNQINRHQVDLLFFIHSLIV